MSRKAIAGLIVLFLVTVGGLFYFFRDEPLFPSKPNDAGDSPPEHISYAGNSLFEEKNGKRVWELTAESIEVNSQTKDVSLNHIKGTFYQENGGKIDLTAVKANMDNKTKDIVMEGDIKAVATDGAVFTAPQAKWEAKDKRFFGWGGVRLVRGDTIATGDKIESDSNMEKVKLIGNAHIVKGGAEN